MRTFVGVHEALDDTEFLELALGTPLELWLGVEGETDDDRAARLAAARDILTDDPGLIDRTAQLAVEAIEAHAPELLTVLPRRREPARTVRKAVAA